MPEYLPLGAFGQGLLPDECRSCAWWQTNGRTLYRGNAASEKRYEWATGLEHDWGCPGLLVQEPTGRRDAAGVRGEGRSGQDVLSFSIHFAPASSLARLHELPFPPLPPSSALLFCLHAQADIPRPLAKRLIRKALFELRNRDVQEVYAIAHSPESRGVADDCRFFSAELLDASGFERVSDNGHLCLMRVDNRGLVSLIGQVEMAVRRVFSHEPAPSPAAWVRGENRAEQRAL
jgi:hypothetical protein